MSLVASAQGDLGPAVESQIALDLVRRSLPFIPFVLLVAAASGGVNGSLSAAYGIALVLCNFVLAAAMLGWAARISFAALGAAALFGYLLRLGLITVAVLVVKDQSWVKLVPLGITIIVTHLGLLLWELRYISASLAHPGLKPERATRPSPDSDAASSTSSTSTTSSASHLLSSTPSSSTPSSPSKRADLGAEE
jgi:hypothetical protein